MTKIEALQYTIIMWQWLAEHPEAWKSQAIAELDLPQIWVADCACCEFARAQSKTKKLDCNNCPLWDAETSCFYFDNPYYVWRDAIQDESLRKSKALEIVALAQQKLELFTESESND